MPRVIFRDLSRRRIKHLRRPLCLHHIEREGWVFGLGPQNFCVGGGFLASLWMGGGDGGIRGRGSCIILYSTGLTGRQKQAGGLEWHDFLGVIIHI